MFIETSAKTAENIDEVFRLTCGSLLEKIESGKVHLGENKSSVYVSCLFHLLG